MKDTTSSARVSQPLPSMVFFERFSPSRLGSSPLSTSSPSPALPLSLLLLCWLSLSLSVSLGLRYAVSSRPRSCHTCFSLSPHWCVPIPFFHQALGPIGRLPSNHYLHSSTPLSSFLALRALSTSFPHCRSHLSSRKNDLHAGGERNFAVREIKERLKPGEQEEKFTEKTAAGR